MDLRNRLDHPKVKKHLLISSLGLSIGLLLHYYFATNTNAAAFLRLDLWLSSFGGILLSYLTYALSTKLDSWIPWKTHLATRFSIGILLHFLTAFVFIVFIYSVYRKLGGSSPEVAPSILIKLAILLLLLMLIYQLVYFALYSYYTYATLQIERVKKEHQQIDLQLKALKSQLSAHFLFNNLNTISSLAFKEPKVAEKYIRGLASIYKYTLNSYHEKLVLLKEELAIVDAYLLLLKTRYGKFIQYSIDIPIPLLTTKIPPLTLQMLVENAIKHNVMDSQNNLQIDLFVDGDKIILKNNNTKTPQNNTSFNIGLQNIDSRFRLMSARGIIISNDTHFTVKIPILQ